MHPIAPPKGVDALDALRTAVDEKATADAAVVAGREALARADLIIAEASPAPFSDRIAAIQIISFQIPGAIARSASGGDC